MSIYNKLHNLIFFFKGFFFFLRIDYYFKLNSNVLLHKWLLNVLKFLLFNHFRDNYNMLLIL